MMHDAWNARGRGEASKLPIFGERTDQLNSYPVVDIHCLESTHQFCEVVTTVG